MMEKKHLIKATLVFMVALLFVGLHSCTTDRSDDFEDYDIDTDGDGIFDNQEVLDGTDKNNPYSGWYTPQTTVRLAVKDKALMDQMTKAAQDFVAMEVQVSGHTVTGFKLLSND